MNSVHHSERGYVSLRQHTFLGSPQPTLTDAGFAQMLLRTVPLEGLEMDHWLTLINSH